MANMHNKSITIVSGSYPYKNQIKLVFVQQLVHALIDMGIKVNVVASQSIIHAIIHKEKLIPTHYTGITENGNKYDIYRPFTLSFGNNNPFKKLTSWYNKKIITSQIKKTNSNIIYTHFWSSALPIYEYALDKSIPLFVACGEGDNELEDMVENMPCEDLRKLSSSVTGVISVSSENKRKCVKYKLAKENNIGVFPNCVNTNIFKQLNVDDLKNRLDIKKDDFVICFVGGFIPRKGPDRIAKAITKLNDPQIKVIFIGNTFPGYPYDFDCPGIIHKGPISHDVIPQYLNCADVFVMPTEKEGCCNAIVESLAVGLPVISSDGAFNDDILNENNSIRVNPNDVDAIAAAIQKLKVDINLRKSMTEYSLSCHEDYSIKRRAYNILNFINKILL